MCVTIQQSKAIRETSSSNLWEMHLGCVVSSPDFQVSQLRRQQEKQGAVNVTSRSTTKPVHFTRMRSNPRSLLCLGDMLATLHLSQPCRGWPAPSQLRRATASPVARHQQQRGQQLEPYIRYSSVNHAACKPCTCCRPALHACAPARRRRQPCICAAEERAGEGAGKVLHVCQSLHMHNTRPVIQSLW